MKWRLMWMTHINKYKNKINSLREEIREKWKIISELNSTIDKEREFSDNFEKEKNRLNHQIEKLKNTNKDIKENMHYYKKNWEKMDKDLKIAYENAGELKAQINKLEMERIHQ